MVTGSKFQRLPTKVGLLPGQVQTIKNGQITIGAVDGTIVVDDYAIEVPDHLGADLEKRKISF